MILSGDVHKEEINIKFWGGKQGTWMSWVSSSWMAWWSSSPIPGSHDELISARGMLLQTFPLLHLPPSLSPLTLHPLSHAETEDPWQVKVGFPLQPTAVVTLLSLFPGCVCKPRTFLKQLNPSVLAPTCITVVKDSGNGGFGVTAPEPGPVTELASPVLVLGKPSTRARASLALPGPVPPGPSALAAALRALGFSTRSYFRQSCSVSLPRAYETLFWDSSPDSLFPLPPHAGKHRLADDFFGKLLRRREQEAPGRIFNPRVYLPGLRKSGDFSAFFFSSQQLPGCGSFSLGGGLLSLSWHPNTHFGHLAGQTEALQ